MQIAQFIIDLGVVYFGSMYQVNMEMSTLTTPVRSIFALCCVVLLPLPPCHSQLCWNRTSGGFWLCASLQLLGPFHQFLFPNVQEAGQGQKNDRKRNRKREWKCQRICVSISSFSTRIILTSSQTQDRLRGLFTTGDSWIEAAIFRGYTMPVGYRRQALSPTLMLDKISQHNCLILYPVLLRAYISIGISLGTR